MPTSNLLPSVVVRYSKRGRELFWCGTASRDSSDGPAAARKFLSDFCEAAGRASSDSAHLRVVPARPGGSPVEVAPVLGQSFAAFLEHTCRNDEGSFQLRAEFVMPSESTCVLVRVAFPGTVPTAENEEAAHQTQPMIVEQFECRASSNIAGLKKLIQIRTGFPLSQLVLLLGARRLHDGLPMSRVAAVTDSRGMPLQCHLAASGAYVFLRREGQQHRVPSGPCSLTLHLPEVVQGARVRSVAFDPVQTLDDFRHSVQAVSGLPPASLEFKLAKSSEADSASGQAAIKVQDGSVLLEAVGITDGCELKVTSSVVCSVTTKSNDIPLDVPTVGNTTVLYERVAERLGIPGVSRIALFSGTATIFQDTDLSSAPLVDGSVLSTYISSSLQLPFSVLARTDSPSPSSAASGATASSSSAAGSSGSSSAAPETASASSVTCSASATSVTCSSTDTIDDVRERIVSTVAAKNKEYAAQIRGSKVFIADSSAWTTNGSTCNSVGALARLLGHFVPCSEHVRLSRLGIAENCAHAVLVPEHHFMVEIQVALGNAMVATRKLRVSGTLRLAEVGKMLDRDLQEQPPPECTLLCCSQVTWALANASEPVSRQVSDQNTSTSMRAPSPRLGVVAAVSSAAAAVVSTGKRKSLGGNPDSSTPSKKRCLGSRELHELSEDDFVSDVHAAHSCRPNDLPSQFLCPISYDVMRDPVVVSGSGNTYDRKSIERHFQTKHTDPIANTELRRTSERRLVPNNALRSQVSEAERSQVDLRLIAFVGEQSKNSSTGEGFVGSYWKKLASAFSPAKQR